MNDANHGPHVQPIALAAEMPPGLQCRLLTLDAPRMEMRVHVRRLLLDMLGEHLKMPAADLQLAFSAHGKPFCPQAESAGLSFSYSYAPPHACVVFGPSSHIGVDIERIITDDPTWNLLEHVFSEPELQQWLRLPAGIVRRHAFTTAWTIKEAVLKARGIGLASSPQSIGASFTADGLAFPATSTEYIWQHLTPAPGFTGAIVIGG
ncbi:4'-phosphopantetheinyl transferase family protein [Prosthecobacter sp.]|uniref:4'-phosphopantetheinyl transferase family protein n=1 Tax=Prosthecobacter sp. TaxID=1965333 RepID=UPI0037831027